MAEMIQRRSNNNGGMEVDLNKGTVSRKGEQTTQGHYSGGKKLNQTTHTDTAEAQHRVYRHIH